MLSKSEEQQLIASALGGSQTAFRELYEYHADSLFRFLNQFSDNRETVKDWTQRAFIKAFNKLDSFRFNSRFKTWLFTIAMNEMRTDLRKTIQFESLADVALKTEPEAVDDKPEHWKKAKAQIRQLDPDKKMIFLLHVAENYSHQEIAEMLDISEVASRVTLHRTKKELKEALTS